MSEFQIGGVTYRSRRMDLFTQAHLAAKLLPMVGAFGDLIPHIKANGGKVDLAKVDVATMVLPLTRLVAEMSNADREFIIGACMGVVERVGESGAAGVWNRQVNQPQFADIDFTVMVQIVGHVLLGQLGSFGPGLARASSGEARP